MVAVPITPPTPPRIRVFRSWHEDGGAFESPCAQIGEGPVRLRERVGRRFRDDAELRGAAEEIEPVLAGEIGDRYQLSFLPQQPVREAPDVAHVDARANDSAALADR